MKYQYQDRRNEQQEFNLFAEFKDPSKPESNNLEKILRWTVPIAVAGAVAVGLEATGLSKYVQEYSFAHSELVKQYWGNFFGAVNYGMAHASRIMFDVACAFNSGLFTYEFMKGRRK
jgi:hypothetical protein